MSKEEPARHDYNYLKKQEKKVDTHKYWCQVCNVEFWRSNLEHHLFTKHNTERNQIVLKVY